jgi:hypothetical protein
MQSSPLSIESRSESTPYLLAIISTPRDEDTRQHAVPGGFSRSFLVPAPLGVHFFRARGSASLLQRLCSTIHDHSDSAIYVLDSQATEPCLEAYSKT